MCKSKNIDELKVKYIGKTFNSLTVIDVINIKSKTGKREIQFVCKCICGNIKNINYNYVLNNKTKSCGCYSQSNNTNKINKLKEDYIGKTFNQLTIIDVIKQYNKNNRSEIMFVCKCACGNIKNIRISHIINNKVYSCGCYNRSLEKARKLIDWYKNHLNSLNDNINNYKLYDFKYLIEIIHPNYIEQLLNGLIGTNDIIETKCPVCNEYAKHKLGNIFILHTGKFKNGNIPLCSKCANKAYSSKYEDEIADYISTFYNGEYIRNSRDIISPLELDLYYPEKKIAIEFNGDYWHSTEFKDNNYHVNKFIKCIENNTLLVSIFESEWNNRKDEIKEYLKDLFNGKENKLSFNEDYSLMNNNYPSINYLHKVYNIQLNLYKYKKYTIYTCGYSIL